MRLEAALTHGKISELTGLTTYQIMQWEVHENPKVPNSYLSFLEEAVKKEKKRRADELKMMMQKGMANDVDENEDMVTEVTERKGRKWIRK